MVWGFGMRVWGVGCGVWGVGCGFSLIDSEQIMSQSWFGAGAISHSWNSNDGSFYQKSAGIGVAGFGFRGEVFTDRSMSSSRFPVDFFARSCFRSKVDGSSSTSLLPGRELSDTKVY